MSDIFREVDEDIRNDRLRKVWDRVAPYVLGAAVLLVLAVAGYRGWEFFQSRKAEASGDRFMAALQLSDQGKYDEAIAALRALTEDGSGSYPMLARFKIAADMGRSGDVAGAVTEFDAIAASNAPEDVRSLAQLRAAMLLVDTASFADMQGRLSGLAATGNPWRHTARELLALSAWRSGDYQAAKGYLDAIANDQEAPQDMRGRTLMLSALVNAKLAANGTPATPAATTPAAPAALEPAAPAAPAATDQPAEAPQN